MPEITKEEWKWVPGFEYRVEVSNFGRVRSWYSYAVKLKRPIIRLLSRTVRGKYWKINLRFNGYDKTFLIHSLVLHVFVGPRPKGMQACHNDGNVNNNHLSNLRWGTPKDNAADQKRHGTAICGERAGASVLTEKDVIKIKKKAANGIGTMRLSREFNCHRNTVGCILRGISWKHIK